MQILCGVGKMDPKQLGLYDTVVGHAKQTKESAMSDGNVIIVMGDSIFHREDAWGRVFNSSTIRHADGTETETQTWGWTSAKAARIYRRAKRNADRIAHKERAGLRPSHTVR